ncbi:hypothetical protein ETSB_0010 [cyanobacterium endosymbiont of Epithemia turgida isolate EtSB Lake Yunoko]|nr:hypothetical protein ETSB_0010 [cyanobacterium endosymbiont of Epithemia turgida isolate EtSB Lake Yunoko]
MLHSTGVSTMAPAGVKKVRVEVNPAIVT